MMEAILNAQPVASAAAIPPPPPSGIEVIDNATGPSPPVAITGTATIDKDVNIKRGVGGAKTPGLDLTHNDVGPLPTNRT